MNRFNIEHRIVLVSLLLVWVELVEIILQLHLILKVNLVLNINDATAAFLVCVHGMDLVLAAVVSLLLLDIFLDVVVVLDVTFFLLSLTVFNIQFTRVHA